MYASVLVVQRCVCVCALLAYLDYMPHFCRHLPETSSSSSGIGVCNCSLQVFIIATVVVVCFSTSLSSPPLSLSFFSHQLGELVSEDSFKTCGLASEQLLYCFLLYTIELESGSLKIYMTKLVTWQLRHCCKH